MKFSNRLLISRLSYVDCQFSSIVQVISCADRPTDALSLPPPWSCYRLIDIGILADDLCLAGLFALFTMEMIKVPSPWAFIARFEFYYFWRHNYCAILRNAIVLPLRDITKIVCYIVKSALKFFFVNLTKLTSKVFSSFNTIFPPNNSIIYII